MVNSNLKHPADDGIDYGVLLGLLGYQLRISQIAVFRDFVHSMRQFDVTPGLFGVLVIIEANAGIQQSALAKAIQLDRSTVVSVIDNLERRKLVERRPVPEDRRRNALTLTPAGLALLKKLKRFVAGHERRDSLAIFLRRSEPYCPASLQDSP